jgi:hypothetical protein
LLSRRTKNKEKIKNIIMACGDTVAGNKWYTYMEYNPGIEEENYEILFKSTRIYLEKIKSKSHLAELDFTFAEEYKNSIEICGLIIPDSDIDIDSIMDRLQNVNILLLDYCAVAGDARYIISRPPKTLKTLLIIKPNVIITNLETTCITEYIFNNFALCAYIPNFPDTITTIKIQAKTINETIYRLPASVNKIVLDLIIMNLQMFHWPINLKKLYINIVFLNIDKINYKQISPLINALPHNLEIFKLHCPKYEYYLDLPPNLLEFDFFTQSEYLYSLDNIPDTIEKLSLYNSSYPYINKLPANCKMLIYLRCDDTIKKKLQERFPDVIVTNKRLINQQ